MSHIGKSNTTLTGLMWAYGERITAQLVSFIVSLILARLLSPENFGTVAIINIVITILNVFVSHGLGNALVQKRDSDDLDFSTVFYCSVVLSIAIYIFIYFLAPFISLYYNTPSLTKLTRVLALRIPIASINTVQHAFVQKKMQFEKFFFSTLLGTIISAFVGIVMAYNNFQEWSIVFQYLTNVIIDTIVLFFTISWKPKLQFSFERLKKLLPFGMNVLLTSLASTTYQQIRSVIIAKKYGSADLAYYDRGIKFPSIIIDNLNSSITKVLFPAFSKIQDDKDRVKNSVRLMVNVTAFLIFPMLVGFIVLSRPFVLLILTSKWVQSVPFIKVFCVSYMLIPIQNLYLQALLSLGYSKITLNLEVIKELFGLIVLFLAIVLYNTPLAIAYGFLLNQLFGLVINNFANRKYYNYSFKEQFSDFMPAACLSLLMAAIIWPISFMHLSYAMIITAQLLFGIIIYVAGAKIFKFKAYSFILSKIKNIKNRIHNV